MTDKICVDEYPFQSSSGNESYIVKRYDDDSLSCGCKGFIFSPKRNADGHRSCRHTDYVHGMIKAEEMQAQAQNDISSTMGIPPAHLDTEKTSGAGMMVKNNIPFKRNDNKPQQSIQPAKRYFSLEDDE
ncbi:MAG: hypothetical protein IMZ53_12725 [Thermoplasmata archaeon]|nr:hypothetical protein [Thermoplasmata archaeon]